MKRIPQLNKVNVSRSTADGQFLHKSICYGFLHYYYTNYLLCFRLNRLYFFYIGKKIIVAIVYDPAKCAPVTTSCTVHDFDGKNDFYFFSTKKLRHLNITKFRRPRSYKKKNKEMSYLYYFIRSYNSVQSELSRFLFRLIFVFYWSFENTRIRLLLFFRSKHYFSNKSSTRSCNFLFAIMRNKDRG